MADRFDQSGTNVRLLDQYRESEKLKALLTALIDGPAQNIRDVMESLRGRLDIDTMSGVQLDRIGDIIGRPRPFVLDFAEAGDALEFTDVGGAQGTAKGFSSLQSPDQGGRFVTGVTNAPMDDFDYRFLLKAQIFANTTAATVEDIELYGTTVLQIPVTVVNSHTQISVQIAGRLSPVQQGIIRDTLQAAAGIGIDSISFGTSVDSFTFDGPSGTGFGSLAQPETGSGFTRLLSA